MAIAVHCGRVDGADDDDVERSVNRSNEPLRKPTCSHAREKAGYLEDNAGVRDACGGGNTTQSDSGVEATLLLLWWSLKNEADDEVEDNAAPFGSGMVLVHVRWH